MMMEFSGARQPVSMTESCLMWLGRSVLIFVITLWASAQAAPAFPVKYSANSRYLVDQNNVPFPILGRTAWFVTSLSEADYQTFVDDTVERGYNSIEFHVINHDPRGNHPPFNGSGERPFTNRLDGAAWSGALNYGNINSEAPNFTTPNPAYWSLVDGVLAYAESKGILVFMFPAYVGFQGDEQGWMQEMVANGPTKMQFYGAWIATRYKDQKNLVWMMGGDFGTSPYSFNTAQTSVENALLTGLKSVAGQQSTLFSAEWTFESIATDQTDFGAAMTLNGVYSYSGYVSYHGRRAYAASPVKPAFLLEEPYDEEGPDDLNINESATQPVRRFQWWGWLSTIGGYISGNGYVWRFRSDSASVDWRNHLNTQGTRDMARLNAFMGTMAWHDLVPSGLNGMRTLITSGGASESLDDYVAAAAAANGTLLVAYVPPAHSGPVTVDMGAMSGPARARWFDPTSAAYTDIGTGLTNTGMRAFTIPGNNSAGAVDWVLVIEVPDTTPPMTPAGLSAKAVGLNRVNLTWSNSTDNVGVTGYRLDRCSGDGCDTFMEVATVSSNSFADVGLPAGMVFRYRVRALDTSTNVSSYSGIATAVTWTAPPAWSGLLADYAFDEGAGATTEDASGHGNTGWLGGVTWTAQGKFNGALSFSGNSFVTVSNSASLNPTTGMTLEAWVCNTTTSSIPGTIVMKEAPGGFTYRLGTDDANRPAVFVNTLAGGAQGATGSSPLPLNTWTHVAGTYDGITLRVYVNGTEAASNPAKGELVPSAEPLRIGGNSIAEEFVSGKIDGVRLYQRPLSPAEVQTDMNRAAGAPPAIVLSALPQTFDEIAGNGFQLILSSDTPATFAIEGTEDFTTWQTISIVQYTNGLLQITDGDSLPPERSLYRVRAADVTPSIFLTAPAQSAGQIAANGFHLIITADAPATMVIERTTDLVNWQAVGSLSYTNGQAEFADTPWKLRTLRFYRARWQ